MCVYNPLPDNKYCVSLRLALCTSPKQMAMSVAGPVTSSLVYILFDCHPPHSSITMLVNTEQSRGSFSNVPRDKNDLNGRSIIREE